MFIQFFTYNRNLNAGGHHDVERQSTSINQSNSINPKNTQLC